MVRYYTLKVGVELGQNVRNIKIQIMGNYEETGLRLSPAKASVFVHLNELLCLHADRLSSQPL